jgi:predicted dehydrogenase
MTFKIGLIGCGGMGMRHIFGHIELRKHFNEIELAAVCDVHKDVAEKAVDVIIENGLKPPDIYTDYMELISSRHLDGIAIVTSTPMHHKIAIASMELGLHVITEKPMGLTMKACRLMEESAKRTNRVWGIRISLLTYMLRVAVML